MLKRTPGHPGVSARDARSRAQKRRTWPSSRFGFGAMSPTLTSARQEPLTVPWTCWRSAHGKCGAAWPAARWRLDMTGGDMSPEGRQGASECGRTRRIGDADGSQLARGLEDLGAACRCGPAYLDATFPTCFPLAHLPALGLRERSGQLSFCSLRHSSLLHVTCTQVTCHVALQRSTPFLRSSVCMCCA